MQEWTNKPAADAGFAPSATAGGTATVAVLGAAILQGAGPTVALLMAVWLAVGAVVVLRRGPSRRGPIPRHLPPLPGPLWATVADPAASPVAAAWGITAPSRAPPTGCRPSPHPAAPFRR